MWGSAARIDDKTCRLELSVAGMPGVVEISHLTGASFHGRWASHTGYRSAFVSLRDFDGSHDEAQVKDYAAKLHREQAAYAFLVGDEHRQYGWKKIKRNYKGEIEIRLPAWQQGVVADCIEAYGMIHSCELNNYWTYPASSGIELTAAIELLRPILRSKTRFEDEQALAKAIDQQAVAMGYALRQPLQSGEAQGSLF